MTPIWKTKSIKARALSGDVFAQVLLGIFLEHGVWMAQNIAVALSWYERAAEENFPPGQHALAYLLWVHRKDGQEALRWLTKAAESGYAPAQFDLGASYQHGLMRAEGESEEVPSLTEPNSELALKYFKSAADQGYIPALSWLASLFGSGKYGVDRDEELALKYAKDAAKRGDGAAAMQYGRALIEQGSNSAVKEGIEWVWKAAKCNYRPALMFLAQAYQFGSHGLQKDENLAQYFYTQAETLQ